jgi:hypothetical protein
MGASTLADLNDNTVIINLFDNCEYIYNKTDNEWLTYPDGFLTVATNEHLGVVKGTTPPTDPTDDSLNSFIKINLDGSMQTIGLGGKVDTVNTIVADSTKNIQINKVYTKTEFENSLDNIPVGEVSTLSDVYPPYITGQWDYSLIEKPVISPDGTQKKDIDGNPVFQRTIIGTIPTIAASNRFAYTVLTGIKTMLPETTGTISNNDNGICRIGDTDFSSGGSHGWSTELLLTAAGIITLIGRSSSLISTTTTWRVDAIYTKI